MGSDEQDATQAALLAERYGTRRRGPLLVATAVLAVIALSWVGWAAWHHANPPVRGELASYDIVSDHQVSAIIDISRRSGDAVTCTVRTQADDHAIVGETDVTIPAGDSGDIRTTVTVTTERRATTATVLDCN